MNDRHKIVIPLAVIDKANHHRLAHKAIAPKIGLQLLGENILAARRDDDILLAPRDIQIAVAIEIPKIARIEPFAPLDLRGKLGHVVIPQHDVFPLVSDLACAVLLHVVNIHRAARKADSRRCTARCPRGIDGHQRRALGKTIPLNGTQAKRRKAVKNLRVNGGTARDHQSQVAAQHAMDVGKDLLFGSHGKSGGMKKIGCLDGDASLLFHAAFCDFVVYLFVERLKQQRNGDHDRGLDLGQILDDASQALTKRHRGTEVKRPQKANRALVGVMKRKHRKEGVPVIHVHEPSGLGDIVCDVEVGKHNPLGYARGTRGKEKHRHGLGVDLGFKQIPHTPIDGAPSAFDQCGKLRKWKNLRHLVTKGDVRKLARHRVRAKDSTRVRNGNDVGKFLGGKLAIHGHYNAHARYHRHVGNHPRVAVFARHKNALTRKAATKKLGAQRLHITAIAAVGVALVFAVLLLHERRLVTKARGTSVQYVANQFRLIAIPCFLSDL